MDGATLPPADRRNQNAASPEENSSFLLDFRAEVWTAWMPKLRGMPVRTRERKGISGPGPAKPSLDSQPFAGPKQHGQEVRVSGKILSLVGGAELRLAGSGPARSHPVRPMPVSWPWSAGSFLGDRVSNSPLKNLNGDVRVLSPTAEAPHVRGRYKSPVHSPPSHPRPVNAFLPWYTHCSLRPHSSDPSSVPTRLTRSPRETLRP